ncbi:MAG: hypothetical protein OCC49_11825 [Fibrobacterales bacterium]
MIRTTLILVLLTLTLTFPNSNHFSCDISTGLAGSSTLTDSISHTSSNNPAIRVPSKIIDVNISACSPYSIPGLSHTQGGVAFSLYEISFALDIAKTESVHLYSQTQYGLSLAHTFWDWITFGLQGTINSEYFPGRQYISGVLKTGMIAAPLPQITMGMTLSNIVSSPGSMQQPMLISIGAAYKVNSQLKLSTAIREGENGNWRKQYGVSWDVFPEFTLQMGLSSQPFTWSLGVVLNLFRQHSFYSRSIHPELGSTNIYGIKGLIDLQE